MTVNGDDGDEVYGSMGVNWWTVIGTLCTIHDLRSQLWKGTNRYHIQTLRLEQYL